MRIILIGNYIPDKQQSMIRFTEMLDSGYKEKGIETEKWLPSVVLGRVFGSTQGGLAKWVGYLDKWILFPLILRLRLAGSRYKKQDVIFHVCDHSNAPYLSVLPANRTVITCHDVIAIRSTMGFKDAAGMPSKFGVFYQKWIFSYLSKAMSIACVSDLTRAQLEEILPEPHLSRQKIQVIHNAFNNDFHPVERQDSAKNLEPYGLDLSQPYILHVGGGHFRKNRVMLVQMLSQLGSQWKGNICFTGEPLDKNLLDEILLKNMKDRVFSIVRADHTTLMSLYSRAYAFVFPSLSEGFGWPVIESQACGTPVITSNREPMMEVSGNAALFADPTDPASFANALIMLDKEEIRQKLIENGFKNCRRFGLPQMLQSYLEFYGAKNLLAVNHD